MESIFDNDNDEIMPELPTAQEDPEVIKAKEIVTDFVHLLEKAKNLYNGLKYVFTSHLFRSQFILFNKSEK